MNLSATCAWLSGAAAALLWTGSVDAQTGEAPLADLPAAVLPPALTWSGASEQLIAAPDDPWITPAERDGFARTPSLADTHASACWVPMC